MDLLGSFEYHDAFLLFVADKYEIDLGEQRIADLDPAWIDALPPEPRGYVQDLFHEYHSIQQAFTSGESGHVEDALQFASRAWRRPLSESEQDRLRWCGYSALYTFLKAVPEARGSLLHYEQWNIDPESVVSFAALEFVRDGAGE